MAHPIPLLDPDGRIHGYLCGLCLHAHAAGSTPGRLIDISGKDAHILTKRLKCAKMCCCCEMCGEVLSKPSLYGRCERCETPFRDRFDSWKQELTDRHTAVMRSKQASTELLRNMQSLSEELFDAGWHDGLATFLWADVLVGNRDELWVLAKQAGGWWDWLESEAGPTLIPLKQWMPKHGTVSPVRCVRCSHYKMWPDGWWTPDVLTSKRPSIGALCPSCWKAEKNGASNR